jgi:carbonic anhydrase/acetyltransferase-like protein (isoleucine patch superfamily)
MAIRPFLKHLPQLGQRVFVDESAQLIGKVTVGDDVSIWPLAVVRGDVHSISIGARSNVQDNAVLHVTHDGRYTPGGSPLVIGSDVTIGHGVILHACTVENACLIGMGAVVLDKVVIGKHSLIGAGAVVAPGKVVEPGSLWVGNPARFIRKLTEGEIESLYYSAENYRKLKDSYLGA